MNKYVVIVLTDEPFVEMAVKSFFADDPIFELAAVCGTQQSLLDATRQYHPHLVVCRMKIDSDLFALRELRDVSSQTGIVVWAREVSAELAHRAVAIGVRGFVSTTATMEQFKDCLQIAAQGELWMEHSLMVSMLNRRPVSLSKRQSELVGLLVQGLKNKEIAASLGISEGTVKAYLTTLYEKVGARDRFELALFGLKNLGDVRGSGLGPELKSMEPLRSLVAPHNSARRFDV